MVSQTTFHEYMAFNSPTENPWSEIYVGRAVNALAKRPAGSIIVSDRDVDAIRFCYRNPHRSYHGDHHGAFVGQDDLPGKLADALAPDMRSVAKPILAISGLFHDTVYKNVDADWHNNYAGAWRPEVEKAIGAYARYEVKTENEKPVFTTFLTEAGKNDETGITQMVARVFGMTDKGMIHNQGGNEFDSALFAAKFLASKGVPPKSILAVTAAIAATVPFKSATNIDPKSGEIIPDMPLDGHMGQIAERVQKELMELNGRDEAIAWADTNDIMLLSVHLANRDIAPFIKPDNAAEVIRGGRGVKKEEIGALRDVAPDIQSLAKAASRTASAPLLYEWFSQEPHQEGAVVPVANVAHLYYPRYANGQILPGTESYPPKEVYDQAVVNTQENCDLASLFFKAHEVGITLAASLATVRDPENPAPGVDAIVNSELWHPQARPYGAWTKREERVLDCLNGTGQEAVDPLTPSRSPIAALIFAAVGEEGIEELSKVIAETRKSGADHPFAEVSKAENLISHVREVVGEEYFQLITTELGRVARGNGDMAWAQKLAEMAPVRQYFGVEKMQGQANGR